MWTLTTEYAAVPYETALVWAPGWRTPREAMYCEASTTDGRGNDVSRATGWLLSNVGAFYEDFGYFTESEILIYGVGAAKWVLPLTAIKLPE